MNVAIIPARGGSKRIPHKNIREFCGQPLIAYSILTARESGLFDRILVSTDDADIITVAKRFGAEVPFIRPADLSDDHTATAPVLIHTTDWLEQAGTPAHHACCIYATAPFMTSEDLKEAYELFAESDADTVFTIATFNGPIFRSLKRNADGTLEMFWPEHRNTRSQDLPEAYHDCGQFYWFHPNRLRVSGTLYATNSQAIMLPRHRVHDIDTPEDWERAELFYKALHQQNEPSGRTK